MGGGFPDVDLSVPVCPFLSFFIGQRLMGETKWVKGVETAFRDFLRFSAAPNHLPCRSRTESAKICENLRQAAVSPF